MSLGPELWVLPLSLKAHCLCPLDIFHMTLDRNFLDPLETWDTLSFQCSSWIQSIHASWFVKRMGDFSFAFLFDYIWCFPQCFPILFLAPQSEWVYRCLLRLDEWDNKEGSEPLVSGEQQGSCATGQGGKRKWGRPGDVGGRSPEPQGRLGLAQCGGHHWLQLHLLWGLSPSLSSRKSILTYWKVVQCWTQSS